MFGGIGFFYHFATLFVICLTGVFFLVVYLVFSSDVDNTNVESRTRSVVKYVINNIMSTVLTVRRNTATYLHLVRKLLYKIEWPSRRLQRIRISCTYRHFVLVLPIICD